MPIITVRTRCLQASALLLAAWPAAAQQVVRYEPTEKDLKYVYATAPPVATLKPGDTLETKTFDAFGNVIRKPGDTLALTKGDNPLTAPSRATRSSSKS
jgi:hypothetical protein